MSWQFFSDLLVSYPNSNWDNLQSCKSAPHLVHQTLPSVHYIVSKIFSEAVLKPHQKIKQTTSSVCLNNGLVLFSQIFLGGVVDVGIFCRQWFCRNVCILSKDRTGFYVTHLYCELLWCFSLILSIWCEGLDKLFFFQHLPELVSQLILSPFVSIRRSLRYGGGSTTWRGSIPSQ